MKEFVVLVSRRTAGSEFQTEGADLEKACLPYCSSRYRGTESLVISLVERRMRETVYGLRRSERYEGRRELKLL